MENILSAKSFVIIFNYDSGIAARQHSQVLTLQYCNISTVWSETHTQPADWIMQELQYAVELSPSPSAIGYYRKALIGYCYYSSLADPLLTQNKYADQKF